MSGQNGASRPVPLPAVHTAQGQEPSLDALAGLDPALRGNCSHGVPLGTCQQTERHLADLKDELLKVRVLQNNLVQLLSSDS